MILRLIISPRVLDRRYNNVHYLIIIYVTNILTNQETKEGMHLYIYQIWINSKWQNWCQILATFCPYFVSHVLIFYTSLSQLAVDWYFTILSVLVSVCHTCIFNFFENHGSFLVYAYVYSNMKREQKGINWEKIEINMFGIHCRRSRWTYHKQY